MIFRRKITSAKWRKSADKSLSQPSCSHSNTIYEVQLQKTIVLRMQPKQEATLQSHLHCGKDPTVANHNGIPSATHPPAPLAIHLHCGNDPTVANHNGILSTTHARKTVDTPFLQCGTDPRMIRDRSETDPSMIRPHTRTVSHPSHRRGRSSRFGDALCMEKHRVSCICYLSKTHFVRDFLQNSIGNSSGSTTCNPICIAGIQSMPSLTLSLTNSFFD